MLIINKYKLMSAPPAPPGPPGPPGPPEVEFSQKELRKFYSQLPQMSAPQKKVALKSFITALKKDKPSSLINKKFIIARLPEDTDQIIKGRFQQALEQLERQFTIASDLAKERRSQLFELIDSLTARKRTIILTIVPLILILIISLTGEGSTPLKFKGNLRVHDEQAKPTTVPNKLTIESNGSSPMDSPTTANVTKSNPRKIYEQMTVQLTQQSSMNIGQVVMTVVSIVVLSTLLIVFVGIGCGGCKGLINQEIEEYENEQSRIRQFLEIKPLPPLVE